ncbi:zinc-binding dehydrogenase
MTSKEAAIAGITDCLEDDAYRLMIGLTLPLDQTAQAHIALERGTVVGKIIIKLVEGDTSDRQPSPRPG